MGSSCTAGDHRKESPASSVTRGRSRRESGRIHVGIGFRLTAVLTSCLVVLLGVSGVFGLDLHRRHLMALLEGEAIGMGETILSSTHYAMLENDRDHLSQIVSNVGSREPVIALRILDGHGVVRFSSHEIEVGTTISIDNAVCVGCHGEARVDAPRTLREALAVYRNAPMERLGLVVPVLNTKECSESGCHVHPASQRVLGIMDLELDTASLEQSIADSRAQMLYLGGATIAVLCAVMGVISWRFVHRPIHALLAGTRRIASGDLSHRLRSIPGGGEIDELTISFNDMTARLGEARTRQEMWSHELEARVAEKTREIERGRSQMVFAEKMVSLGKLAAIVAHEINNPLAGILVSVRTLRRKLSGLDPQYPDAVAEFAHKASPALELVEQETARCGDIVRNLLLFSRRKGASMSPQDLNQIIRRSVLLVSHQAELQDVESHLDLDASLPEVTCDAGQLEQACVALIMNAIEAMPAGGALDVRSRYLEEPARARVEVSDTGVGIPEANRDRVFEPFFTTKSEERGTGLGLSVLYGIVQRHGGTVDFTSTPEGGTTFFFEVPLNATAMKANSGTVTNAAMPPE